MPYLQISEWKMLCCLLPLQLSAAWQGEPALAQVVQPSTIQHFVSKVEAGFEFGKPSYTVFSCISQILHPDNFKSYA